MAAAPSGTRWSGLPAMVRDRSLSLALWAAREPWTALALWGLLTLMPIPGLLLLRMETDGRSLVPRGDPAVRKDAEVRERFHLRDPFIVFVRGRHPDGIYDPATLRTLREVTERLRSFPEIGSGAVTSLATEKRDRLVPGSHESFVTFLEPFPSTPALLDELRRDLQAPAARVYQGTLVSTGHQAAAVFAGVRNGEGIDRGAVYRRIVAASETLAGPGTGVLVVGAPAAEALLGDHVLRDLAVLLPMAVLLVAAILWIGTRRPACVLLVLAKAGLCIAWTFGLLGCAGVPVYLTTAVLPVVLATLCIADEIHLLMRFQRALPEAASSRAAVQLTLTELVTPVVLATTTTSAGFLSFAASPLGPIRSFGLAAAAGILYSLGFSLVATPALLASLPASRFRRPAPASPPAGKAGLPGLLLAGVRHPRTSLALIALVTLAAVPGLARLTVHDSWIESFARRSPFRLATEQVNRSLGGTHVLNVHLAFSGSAPSCADPAVLARLGRFEELLRRRPEVGGALGLHTQLTALAHFWNSGAARPEVLLDDRREILRLLNRYELSPGLHRRRQVVTDGFRETVVTVFLKNANYQDTRKLMSWIEDHHRAHLAPLGASLGFAGDVAVSQATIPAIVRTQMLSLPLALLGVFAAIALLYGSWRLALCALLPVAVSAAWLLGSLGWTGIPLGIATSTFFAIALGLGVDSQSIHFLDRYQQLACAGTADPAVRTLADVGPAVAVNTAAVASGFGLLAVSSVPANARLGLLVALALVLGGALTLAGLGALLELLRSRSPSGTGVPEILPVPSAPERRRL